MRGSFGSTMIRVTNRFGRRGEPSSTFVQTGELANPLEVTKISPLLWPTQMTFEFPFATAIALMLFAGSFPVGGLIALHDGPPSLFDFLALFVTQRDRAPARRRFGSLGSRMNGAMKFAVPLFASVIGLARALFSQDEPFQ